VTLEINGANGVAVRADVDPRVELARYDAACRAIEAASSVDELSSISDVARAMRAAAHILDNRESEVQWSVVHVRAERRLGELVKLQKETVGMQAGARGRAGPGRGHKNGVTESERNPVLAVPTLADAGITKKVSARSQKLAAVPEAVVEQAIARAMENTEPVSVPDILRQHRTAERRARERSEIAQEMDFDAKLVIHCSDIDDVTADMLPDASVSAIVTDPPYLKKFLPVFSSLANFAERVLAPGGWCVVMTGAIFLPEVLTMLGAKLQYRWQYVVTTPGGPTPRIGTLGLFQSYKPVLLFQKPPISRIREMWPDLINAKAGEHDKSLHKWQQNEAVFAELVKRLTKPGDLVVDPFAGSGTTGRAAINQGRHFWGCDVDKKCATVSRMGETTRRRRAQL
jgi:16S rRNA G966 N2-methylase RsmD